MGSSPASLSTSLRGGIASGTARGVVSRRARAGLFRRSKSGYSEGLRPSARPGRPTIRSSRLHFPAQRAELLLNPSDGVRRDSAVGGCRRDRAGPMWRTPRRAESRAHPNRAASFAGQTRVVPATARITRVTSSCSLARSASTQARRPWSPGRPLHPLPRSSTGSSSRRAPATCLQVARARRKHHRAAGDRRSGHSVGRASPIRETSCPDSLATPVAARPPRGAAGPEVGWQ